MGLFSGNQDRNSNSLDFHNSWKVTREWELSDSAFVSHFTFSSFVQITNVLEESKKKSVMQILQIFLAHVFKLCKLHTSALNEVYQCMVKCRSCIPLHCGMTGYASFSSCCRTAGLQRTQSEQRTLSPLTSWGRGRGGFTVHHHDFYRFQWKGLNRDYRNTVPGKHDLQHTLQTAHSCFFTRWLEIASLFPNWKSPLRGMLCYSTIWSQRNNSFRKALVIFWRYEL